MILSTEVQCPTCGRYVYAGNDRCPYDQTELGEVS